MRFNRATRSVASYTRTETNDTKPVLQATDLVKHFRMGSNLTSILLRRRQPFVHALDGVSISIGHEETVALVGESGSGKTTLGLAILRLIRPDSGNIIFNKTDITKLSERELSPVRRQMQVVFQDPSSSLDPRKTAYSSIGEPLRAHGYPTNGINQKITEVADAVGLSGSRLDNLPQQFSGGQKQRICIARALVLRPKLVVLDEPTSSLDVSVQSQILLLLQKLQSEFSLSYLLITHNMTVARYLADRIAVMYLGKIIELGTTDEVTSSPRHPYAQQLIASVLEPGVSKDLGALAIKGEPPSAVNPPKGCRFNTRCPYVQDICHNEEPPLREFGPEHIVACHFAEDIAEGRIVPSN